MYPHEITIMFETFKKVRHAGFQSKQDMEQNKRPHNNIYTSTKPLLRLSQLVGLAPLSWPDFGPSTYGTIYTSIILATLLAWFVYTVSLSIMHEYPGKMATFIIPDLFNSAAIYTTSLTSLVLCVTAIRNKPETVMRLISQVDETVMAGSPNYVHNKTRLVVLVEMVVAVSLITTLAIYDNLVWTGQIWNFHNYTGRYFAHLVNAVLVLQFSNLALLLKTRFAKLNHLLQTTASNYDDSDSWLLRDNLDSGSNAAARTRAPYIIDDVALNTSIASVDAIFGAPTIKRVRPMSGSAILAVNVHPMSCQENSTHQKLFALRRAHATLCEVASMVNGMYGVQILLVMTSEFIGSVWVLYLVLVTTMSSEMTERKQQSVILYVFWLIYRFLKILYVLGSCHLAQTEAKRTGTLIHQVLLQEEVRRGSGRSSSVLQLQLFSQQLLHSRYQVDFTACGFFPLDMTLLHSVVGAVTTYIIILMQFHSK